MNIDAFYRQVNNIDWHLFDGPEYYSAEKVAPALMALATVDKIDLSRQLISNPPNIDLNGPITGDLMFAIGNDHCGSYYPAAFSAVDFILEVALRGNTIVSRNCALNALVSLYYFSYDPGRPMNETLRKDEEAKMKATISAHNAKLLQLAESDDNYNRTIILDFINSQIDNE